MDKPPLKLLAKLVEARKRIKRIEKDATNARQGYDYTSEKATKETYRPILDDLNLFLQFDIVPSGVRYLGDANPMAEPGKPADGRNVVLPIAYTWWDVDSGESLPGTFAGDGQTRDDKGFYAALTGAIKYFLTTNLLVPTGDDPESDKFDKNGHTEPPQQEPPRQQSPAPANGKEPKPQNVKGPYAAKWKFQCICGNAHEKDTMQYYWKDANDKYVHAAKDCYVHKFGE